MRACIIGAVVATACVVGFGWSSAGPSHADGTPTVTSLLEQQLDPTFTPGREVRVDRVELPPNGRIERHWHPGEEFHYYLDGEVRIEIDGEPPRSPVAGTVGHMLFGRLHTAVAGPHGARILVFRVHTSGAPWRYDEGQTGSVAGPRRPPSPTPAP